MGLHVELWFMSNIAKNAPPPGSDANAIYKSRVRSSYVKFLRYLNVINSIHVQRTRQSV